MQINSISMVSANRNIGFKAAEKNQPKPLVEVTPDMPDDQVVQYSHMVYSSACSGKEQ